MTCPDCGDTGMIQHEGGASVCFCPIGQAGPLEARLAANLAGKPILMSSQERIELANLLDRMAESPADYFDPDKLRLAADCIHYHEAKLTLIRSAVD